MGRLTRSRFHRHRASIATHTLASAARAASACLDSTVIEHRSRPQRSLDWGGAVREVSIPQPSSIDRDPHGAGLPDRWGTCLDSTAIEHRSRLAGAGPHCTQSLRRSLDSTAIEHRSRRRRLDRRSASSGARLDSTAIEHRSRRAAGVHPTSRTRSRFHSHRASIATARHAVARLQRFR